MRIYGRCPLSGLIHLHGLRTEKNGAPAGAPFFCLIWLVVAQIDLRINSRQERGRLQDAGKATVHHRIDGCVKQSSSAALTFELRPRPVRAVVLQRVVTFFPPRLLCDNMPRAKRASHNEWLGYQLWPPPSRKCSANAQTPFRGLAR